MMSNLRPGAETVSLLVSGYNEEQHPSRLARLARFRDSCFDSHAQEYKPVFGFSLLAPHSSAR
jgi:hypothetical protein